MKAIILAAGRGSRLQNLTDTQPKCMVHLAGKPLLDYQITSIQQAGITDIAIVCGYANEAITDQRITKKFINSQWQSTNMVYSLIQAAEWLKQEACIISYSDIFYESSAIRSLIDTDSEIAMTYDRNFLQLWSARFNEPLSDLETFKLNTDGSLADIGGKPKNTSEIDGQYMGLLKITPNGWREIDNHLKELGNEITNKLDMTSLLMQLIRKNIRILAIPYDDRWGEIDHQSDIALYEKLYFLNSKQKLLVI